MSGSEKQQLIGKSGTERLGKGLPDVMLVKDRD